jgi:hypothetical protein
MAESRRCLPYELTGGQERRVTYNVSAPLDQIDSSDALRKAYDQIAFRSWRLSGGIVQGMAMKQAAKWLAEVSKLPLPPESECDVIVCSEACATIASYVLSPEMEEGLYCLVDIGAWTTDISFFRITEVQRSQTGVPTTAFYAARCHRKAANAIDDRCLSALLEIYGEPGPGDGTALQQIRERREAGDFATREIQLGQVSRVPPSAALEYARTVVGESIGRSFMETMKQAYAKENRQDVWKTPGITLFRSGGGAKEDVVIRRIGHSWIRSSGPIPRPSNLVVSDGCDYARMSVAYGLAFPVAVWPKEIPPSGVDPLRPQTRRRPDFHDLGFGR